MGETFVITGGSGHVSTLIRPALQRDGRTVRLMDTKPLPTPAGPGEGFLEADISDLEANVKALQRAELVVHLAGWGG